jgi:hypothetical protein
MIYDVVIIGSGISGLYAAYNIKRHDPNLSIIVLEKHKRRWIGGRTSNEPFYGTSIATGAGIGRKRDRLLKRLLHNLGYKTSEFRIEPQFAKSLNPVDVKDILSNLREEYQKTRAHEKDMTFERFAKHSLGVDTYNRFLLSSGYRDYEKAGTKETLYDYGMEDNACCMTAFGVHWIDVVHDLAAEIGENAIKFSQNVVAIEGAYGAFSVVTEAGRKYNCKKIIVATTITSLRTLFPRNHIYREIEGQPFLRVYGKFAKQSIPIMKACVRSGHLIVPGLIQKIIAIKTDEGVYMIVYNDNKYAVALKDRTENTATNREFYCELLERSLGIPGGMLHLIAIRSFYWAVGTHYYPPLDVSKYESREDFIREAQNPAEGVVVVGEVVSRHQGWVEGALESVEAVVTKKWIGKI